MKLWLSLDLGLTYWRLPQQVLANTEAELAEFCLYSDHLRGEVDVILSQLAGPEVVLVVDCRQRAIIGKDHEGVVETLPTMVTVVTALHHTTKVGRHVDVILCSQAAQSVLQVIIFSSGSLVVIAGIGPVTLRRNKLQEWSQDVSAFVAVAVYAW